MSFELVLLLYVERYAALSGQSRSGGVEGRVVDLAELLFSSDYLVLVKRCTGEWKPLYDRIEYEY